MEDWDLQAVVRGCCTSEAMENIMSNPTASLFAPLSFDLDGILAFPEISDETTADYFEGLCKPFHPMLQQALSPQSLVAATTSISVPQELKQPQKVKRLQEEKPLCCDSTVRAVKIKRSRKNQHKRVVEEVGKDGLSSDSWAWRKYGQKPIKGSPHPRSYYRCSSSKGCLARKQVERSSSDPSTFIITYTGEHSHAQPTRRNSLAGSTRNKSLSSRGFKSNEPNMAKTEDEGSSNSGTIPCPATASLASAEEEFAQSVSIKTEQQEQVLEECDNNEMAMPNIVFSDELFPSIEDLEGLLLDQFTVPCSLMDHQQFHAVDTH